MPARSSHRPTIIDVARIAGVSKSTVSAALLNDHRIARKTREKVHEAARQMGYVPDPHAAALATREKKRSINSPYVAIVSHFPRTESLASYDCCLIRNRLMELGYQSRHFDLSRDKVSSRELRRMLYGRGYCGIIFDQIRDVQSEIVCTDWAPFCLISSGRTYTALGCDTVRGDPFKSVTLSWQEIRKGGYRRVGYLLCRHRPIMLDDAERQGALAFCQASLGAGEEAIPPYTGWFDDWLAIKKWYRRHRPDVVVGFNGIHRRFLLEMGRRIPQDVGYANLHEIEATAQVAGVDIGEEEARSKTAEHLDFLVRHRRTGIPDRPWEILAQPQWVPGLTLPV